MKRRLRYIFIILYNLIRMPFKVCLSGFNIRNSPIQLISPLASIASDRGGTVRIKGASQIATGATVVKDVPENTLVGGVPAKILKQYVKT